MNGRLSNTHKWTPLALVTGDKKGVHWYQWTMVLMVLLVNMHLIKGT